MYSSHLFVSIYWCSLSLQHYPLCSCGINKGISYLRKHSRSVSWWLLAYCHWINYLLNNAYHYATWKHNALIISKFQYNSNTQYKEYWPVYQQSNFSLPKKLCLHQPQNSNICWARMLIRNQSLAFVYKLSENSERKVLYDKMSCLIWTKVQNTDNELRKAADFQI